MKLKATLYSNTGVLMISAEKIKALEEDFVKGLNKFASNLNVYDTEPEDISEEAGAIRYAEFLAFFERDREASEETRATEQFQQEADRAGYWLYAVNQGEFWLLLNYPGLRFKLEVVA